MTDETRYFTLDLSAVRSKKALHRLLAETLPLPSYYGKNLDALYDVLTDGHEPWALDVTGCTQARQALGEYFDSFKATLADAIAEGAALATRWDEDV